MNSRSRILETVRKHQRGDSPLPDDFKATPEPFDKTQKFITVLESIGGSAILVGEWGEIDHYLRDRFSIEKRWVNLVHELPNAVNRSALNKDPHLLENVSLTIINGNFGVAENGAVWVTDDLMGDRALPFICENLALVISAEKIFPTMHDAYQSIGDSQYPFGTFIAGPSKTADIEQSLVLGAHGPKSLTVFLRSEH